ncbi:MAG: hypothetical protein ACW96U_11245 [Candidatus Heimdallarchaeaceae archaeon]|jgi:hypothetical protein
MKKYQIFITCFFLSTIIVVSSLTHSAIAIRDEISDEWDYEGTLRVQSEEQKLLIYDPTDSEYENPPLNDSINGYERPQVYFQIMGFDTLDDQLLDHYYGFYGISYFDLSDFYNYTVEGWNRYWVVINAKWRLRIPEGSDAQWEVLYYPDPYYDQISVNLLHKVPIYYVNLTKNLGCNLEYRIDLGLNYTRGNFTTFGPGGELLYPGKPSFPGYNVALPLFTGIYPVEYLVETGFFSNAISFVMIVSISFGLLHKLRKRRKRKR